MRGRPSESAARVSVCAWWWLRCSAGMLAASRSSSAPRRTCLCRASDALLRLLRLLFAMHAEPAWERNAVRPLAPFAAHHHLHPLLVSAAPLPLPLRHRVRPACPSAASRRANWPTRVSMATQYSIVVHFVKLSILTETLVLNWTVAHLKLYIV